jgi:signal transduction histidine kinase
MNTPIAISSTRQRWWSRRIAVLPLFINVLVLGVLLASGFSVRTQKVRMAHRLSVERQIIEEVTNIRRDARKTYVALLDRWLASPEDWPRLRSDVIAQQAVLGQSLRGFDREIDLGADERRLRAELTADTVAWCTVVERSFSSSQGAESRHEVKQGLKKIDHDCSESLKVNAASADRDEAGSLALERRTRRLDVIFLATLALFAMYATVLYLQRSSARRIAEVGRRQQEQEAQSRLLERLVHTRTSELEESHRRLNGSMAELSASKQSLELRVRDLATMQGQLVQAGKLQAVGQLAAGIAHEINTPTQYIGDNIRFLAGAFVDVDRALAAAERALAAARANCLTPELIGEVDDEIARIDLPYLRSETPSAIAQAEEGVQRVSAIVRAMKEFAHPGSPEMAPADLNRAIESSVTVSRSEWKYVADLTLDLAPELPPVSCQIGEIKQVILNLIVNAAHAVADVVGDGAGEKGRIVVATRLAGDWAEILVTDSGTGIPVAVRERIFDPFFTTKAVGRGSGQGLAVTHAVVGHHKGSITFETQEGAGTTFRVRLPLVQQTAEGPECVEEVAGPVRGG